MKKITSLFLSIMMLLMNVSPALAYVTTDKEDYSPGSTVTISGDNSDDAGYIAGETVEIDVTTPYGSESGETTVNEDGSFSWQFVLPEDDSAVGNYFYNVLGLLSGVSQDETFTDNKNFNITFAGTGGGTIDFSGVTGTPLPSTDPCTTTCSNALNNNATGTLTVTANPGSTFIGWSGSFVTGGTTTCSGTTSPCTFSLDNDTQALTATFNLEEVEPVTFDLDVTVDGSGSVTSNIGAINCPSDCDETYDDGDEVVLTAVPDLGSTFTGWSDDCTGTSTCDLTMSENKNVTATFNLEVIKTDPTLSVDNSPATYDGSAQAADVSGDVAGVVSDVKYDNSSTVPTDAGTYAITADFVPTDTVNYNNLSDAPAGDFVIEQADATCIVTGDSVIYDGDPHGASGTCTGVDDEDAGTLDLGFSFTDVPGGLAHWVFTGNGNYNNNEGDVAITITKADASCTVTGYDVTYNGLSHTATGSCLGVLDETLSGLDLTSTTHTNAGSYPTDPWTFTDVTGNYKDDSDTIADNIDPAILTITASSASMLQGGPLPAVTASYDGFVNGETSAVIDTLPTCSNTTDGVTAGDFDTQCTGALDNNYTIGYKEGTLHVYAIGDVFHGFFKPITLSIKEFQKNSTIPVKFALSFEGGENFYGGPAELLICKEVIGPCDEITGPWVDAKSSGGSNFENDFRYDPVAKQYIFNLSTKMNIFTASNKYDLSIKLNGITYVPLINVIQIKSK